MIVNLKRKNKRGWHNVVFEEEAYVEVTLDDNGRPGDRFTIEKVSSQLAI